MLVHVNDVAGGLQLVDRVEDDPREIDDGDAVKEQVGADVPDETPQLLHEHDGLVVPSLQRMRPPAPHELLMPPWWEQQPGHPAHDIGAITKSAATASVFHAAGASSTNVMSSAPYQAAIAVATGDSVANPTSRETRLTSRQVVWLPQHAKSSTSWASLKMIRGRASSMRWTQQVGHAVIESNRPVGGA